MQFSQFATALDKLIKVHQGQVHVDKNCHWVRCKLVKLQLCQVQVGQIATGSGTNWSNFSCIRHKLVKLQLHQCKLGYILIMTVDDKSTNLIFVWQLLFELRGNAA